jgi:hypothetical protein
LAVRCCPGDIDWIKASILAGAHAGHDPHELLAAAGSALPELSAWARDVVASRVREKCSPGWLRYGILNKLLLGVFYTADSLEDALGRLYEASDKSHETARSLFGQLWVPSLITQTPPDRIDDMQREPSAESKKYVRQLQSAGPGQARLAALEKLRQHLSQAGDDEFRAVANDVIEKLYAEWVWDLYEQYRFVGLSLSAPSYSGNVAELFEAVAGAVVPNAIVPGFPKANASEPHQSRRFTWLMSRLAYELRTKRLTL